MNLICGVLLFTSIFTLETEIMEIMNISSLIMSHFSFYKICKCLSNSLPSFEKLHSGKFLSISEFCCHISVMNDRKLFAYVLRDGYTAIAYYIFNLSLDLFA